MKKCPVKNQTHKPAAVLLTSTHCPHCQSLKTLLIDRNTRGQLQQLDVINIEQSPEQAQQYQVRSVPWLQLGEFVFDRALSPGELDYWINESTANTGISHYLEYLLENGKLGNTIEWLEQGKATLQDVIPLLSNPDTKLNVRLGIGAIMETYEDTDAIREIIPDLIGLAQHVHPAIRTDVCHYLSLTHSNDAIEPLTAMLADEDQQVRQTAKESLDELSN